MRPRTSAGAAAVLAVTSAIALAGCGGGGGGSSDTISSPPTTTAPAPTTTPPQASGAPLKLDPAFALPADVKLRFTWPTPAGHAESQALDTTANFMESMVYGVIKQNAAAGRIGNYATAGALTYGREYVQEHVKAKKTVTGTDLFYRPVVKLEANKTVAQVTFCENQSAFFSKEIATGKVHTTTPSLGDYTSYALVVVKAPTRVELWQVQSVNYKERAVECKQ